MPLKLSLDNEGNLHTNKIIETKHQPLHMDYTIWEDGQSGNVGPFQGRSDGNTVVLAEDPWGKITPVWRSGESGHSTYPSRGRLYYSSSSTWSAVEDVSKMYRMSWWERRVTNGTASYARYYAGLNGYGSVNGVYRRDNGSNNTNPYFHMAGNLVTSSWFAPVGEWCLVVGHVWPADSGTGDDHIDSGLYTINSGKIRDLRYRDYVLREETDRLRSRTLSIYRGDTDDVVHHTVYPRMDVCDGTEPSIEELLSGFDSHNIDYVRAKGGTSNISLDVGATDIKMGVLNETAITKDIKGWWPLGASGDDISGGSNNGTPVNVTTVPGIEDVAYSFNGIEGAVDLGESVSFSEDSWTLTSWFNSSDIGSLQHFFGNPSHVANTGWTAIRESKLALWVHSSNDPNRGWHYGNTILNSDTWYHMALRYDGEGNYQYLLNGELDTNWPNFLQELDHCIFRYMGCYTTTTGRVFNGILDGMRVYNSWLTDKEINILYDLTGGSSTIKMKQTKNEIYIKGGFQEI